MDCLEITQIPAAQVAIKSGDDKLKNDLFRCIYKLFYTDFLDWINADYAQPGKGTVEELAKDAFQEGLYKFFVYTQSEELKQKASLRTIIFTFCKWQFMALNKQDKNKRSREVAFDEKDNTNLGIAEVVNNDAVYWDEVFQILLSEKEHMLYQAIRLLPKDKWHNAIMWRYFDKLETPEIAEKLGVSIGDVYNTLSHAKEALKEILQTKFNFSIKSRGFIKE